MTTPRQNPTVTVRDLGAMPYAEAFALQKRLQAEVIASRDPETGFACTMHLLLVEHDPPVITVSRRKGARDHLLAGESVLADAGIEVHETDRGGDITYHGPGQLVVYPILDLNALHLRLHGYMRFLEDVVMTVLSGFNISSQRDACATGVWVPMNASPGDSVPSHHAAACKAGDAPTAKICAMGVRVAQWVSMHGLALNVHPNLEHFKLIVPCGLAGRAVTSMKERLGDACPGMNVVTQAMTDTFMATLHAAQSGNECERETASES
jgi:lipoyl(octanoyl) transferase